MLFKVSPCCVNASTSEVMTLCGETHANTETHWFVQSIGQAISSHDVTDSGVFCLLCSSGIYVSAKKMLRDYVGSIPPPRHQLQKNHLCMNLGFWTVHSHVSLHQSVHGVYGPAEAAQQDDDQDNDDQSRKPPAQQEVEQVPALCVLVIHHQHLPEVHCLRGQMFEKATNLRAIIFHLNRRRPSDVRRSNTLELWRILFMSHTATLPLYPHQLCLLYNLAGFDRLFHRIHWALHCYVSGFSEHLFVETQTQCLIRVCEDLTWGQWHISKLLGWRWAKGKILCGG